MQLPDFVRMPPLTVWLPPVLALAAAPITTDSYREYALPFVMFVCTVFFGQWLVDKVERSEWRQKLREEANAAKSARDAADPDQKGLPPGFDALAASKKAEAEKKAAAKVGSGSAKKKR